MVANRIINHSPCFIEANGGLSHNHFLRKYMAVYVELDDIAPCIGGDCCLSCATAWQRLDKSASHIIDGSSVVCAIYQDFAL